MAREVGFSERRVARHAAQKTAANASSPAPCPARAYHHAAHSAEAAKASRGRRTLASSLRSRAIVMLIEALRLLSALRRPF